VTPKRNDLPPPMAEQDEPVEQPERDRRDDEQVDRGNPVGVVAKKSPPALARRTSPRAPQRVGKADLMNEISNVLADRRTPCPTLRPPAPIGSKPRAMPAYDRLGPQDCERAQHARPQSIEPDEQQPITARQARPPGSGSPQDVQLMAEKQNLGLKPRSRHQPRSRHHDKQAEDLTDH
jgi:hypothetical protein